MDIKRPGFMVVSAAMLICSGTPAWAAGFGEPTSGAVLGQPLNFTVPVRLDAGADLDASCVFAEVSAGDRSLPEASISTSVERTGLNSLRVRVATASRMDEPLVSVVLHVGCGSRSSRQFFVFVDPPNFTQSAPLLATAALALPNAESIAAPAVSGSTAAPERGLDAAAAAARVSAASPLSPTPPAARQPRTERAQRAAPDQRTRPAPRPQVERVSRVAVSAVVAAESGPRLRLEAPVSDLTPIAVANSSADMLAVEQALQAVAAAASAIETANRAASAAALRAQDLERSLQQLQADTQAQRDSAGLIRERLNRAESLSTWVQPLLAGLLALTALAIWLGWQIRSLRRERQWGWQDAKAQSMLSEAQASLGQQTAGQIHSQSYRQGTSTGFMADTGPASAADVDSVVLASRTRTAPQSLDGSLSRFAASEGLADGHATTLGSAPSPRTGTQTPRTQTPRTQTTRAWPPPAPADDFLESMPPPAHEADEAAYALASQPLPAAKVTARAATESATRDLSIEELIDLEQQAEFFIVLGQDDAAIDLLVEHIRVTGGSSPLPYLKMLEIYQRRGEREPFERTRKRFNQRFNAYAAEWGTSLDDGKGLESYAGVLPRLQQIWPRPLDAMAELEALMFRKSRGELFDLPAYREVLFLYALARDLLDRADINTGTVDLLLPLADGGEFSATAPHPYFGTDSDSVFDRTAADDAADMLNQAAFEIDSTAPVDLDLSQEVTAERIIDSVPPRKQRKAKSKT